MNIDIRPIKKMNEIHPVLNLMKKVWSLSDLEVNASFEMKAVTQFGIVLGAYDLNVDPNKPIGFIYGFPKFPNIHYSHQMGVDQDYQNRNVGYLLKRAHRKLALESTNPEIFSIEWTVDPLLGPNAGLNFRKLGVICNQYFPNYYGIPDGAVDLYPSVPTDRILVEWRIRSPRVVKRFDMNQKLHVPWQKKNELYKVISPIEELEKKGELLFPPKVKVTDINVSKKQLCLEVPSEFTNMSKIDLKIALEWREKFKNICIYLFDNNFFLVDFISFKTDTNRENIYIFTRDLDSYEY